ncbi:dihydrofolate reductase [Ruminococcaceae bacterium YRB3002]|nr:dihydrofolate reductase [Ruminococcaceae bacterium YRB3002]
MIAIAAVDRNWGIGYKGELLISLPEDQKGVFRKYTSGHTVVYGRKTLQTFPGERLLPNRVNIIMTRNPSFAKEGAVIIHSTEELARYLRKHRSEEIFLIGGAEIYNTFIELCDHAIITSIKAEFTADAFFPNLDEDPSWILEEEEPEIMSEKGVAFTVKHYKRIS